MTEKISRADALEPSRKPALNCGGLNEPVARADSQGVSRAAREPMTTDFDFKHLLDLCRALRLAQLELHEATPILREWIDGYDYETKNNHQGINMV